MIVNESIIHALHQSTLVAEFRESEIGILLPLLTTRHYKKGEYIARPGSCELEDALLILVGGKVEVVARVEDEPMVMHLKDPGDIARVISFVGGNMMKIDATIEVTEDCAVLLLEREKLETLLSTHPVIVYNVMRGLVRFAHSLARHKSAETEELSNYFYRINGRF